MSFADISNPAFFNAFSNAGSGLINLNPNERRPALPAMNDLPEPGPPAKNTALNIAGSFGPSGRMSIACSHKSASTAFLVPLVKKELTRANPHCTLSCDSLGVISYSSNPLSNTSCIISKGISFRLAFCINDSFALSSKSHVLDLGPDCLGTVTLNSLPVRITLPPCFDANANAFNWVLNI